MVRTETLQAEEWKELQMRHERLSMNLQKAQDDFSHRQVVETMQDLEATQQKMYIEWEENNKELRRQLEKAKAREAGVALNARSKEEELERMRLELEEERRKRGVGEERAEEMMRLIEEVSEAGERSESFEGCIVYWLTSALVARRRMKRNRGKRWRAWRRRTGP